MNKKITYKDIMSKYPCYDPAKEGYCTEDWEGTLLDILKSENVPAVDRIWVVIRFLDDKTNRLFAVWCAREALKLTPNPDPISIKACDVAEAYAYGKATKEELGAARAAAMDAASATVWDAASAAAWAAASAAAWAAAWAAASAAAWAARYAASEAASEAAQVKKLIEMLEENCKNEIGIH